jgi:hypothetical protein
VNRDLVTSVEVATDMFVIVSLPLPNAIVDDNPPVANVFANVPAGRS